MSKSTFLIRNIDAGKYLEIFLVSAIASILVIRLFLELTGYPQIGNSTLHIAHMLWGGLLMLISIIILFSFLTKGAEWWAALLGGIGFGTFIDEVGKFVTSDNNYFFEPAVSIMYVTFILIYIAIHTIQTGWSYSKNEYLINALQELKEVALHDLGEEEKNKALNYLRNSNPLDPLVISVRNLISNTKTIPSSSPGLYTRVKSYLHGIYLKFTQYRAFSLAIVIFFLAKLIVSFSVVLVFIFFVGLGWERILNIEIIDHVAKRMENLSFIEVAELLSSLLSGVLVFIGIYYIKRSRLLAYKMFEHSILISIFLTQVFMFYKEQFAALTGLAANILILVALRFMIEREESQMLSKQGV